jgi:GNAT superfamily N-acetyltransferase
MMTSLREIKFSNFFTGGIKTIHYLLRSDTTLFKFRLILKNSYRLREPSQDLELSLADTGDHAELLECSSHLTSRQMRDRFALGHMCILVRKEGRIISHAWIGLNKIRLRFRGKSFALPPDTAYFYDVRTDEGYRGGKVFKAIVSYVREFCLGNGILFAFTLVDPRIGLPVRAYMKLVGAHEIFLVRFRRRLGIGLYSEQKISEEEARRLSKEFRSM